MTIKLLAYYAIILAYWTCGVHLLHTDDAYWPHYVFGGLFMGFAGFLLIREAFWRT